METMIRGEVDVEVCSLNFEEFLQRACLQIGYSPYNATHLLREIKGDERAFQKSVVRFSNFIETTVQLNVCDGLAEDYVREELDRMLYQEAPIVLEHFRAWNRSLDQ